MTLSVLLGKDRSQSIDVTISSQPTQTILLDKIPNFLTVPEFLQCLEPFSQEIARLTVCTTKDSSCTFSILASLHGESTSKQIFQEFHGKCVSALTQDPVQIYFIDVLHSALPGEIAQVQRSTGSQSVRAGEQCSICLEPLVSEEGELITQCGHSFHIDCYMKVPDDHCPLCRFNSNLGTQAHCDQCSNTDDLWMCLVCGKVNCGRYSSGHAEKHFQATNHSVSVEVGGFRVWDYSRDAFVHRVVTDETTLDDHRPRTSQGTVAWWAVGEDEEAELEAAKLESKADFVAEFYSQILLQQLEQQQIYYETKLSDAVQLNSIAAAFLEERSARKALVAAFVTGYKEIVQRFKVDLSRFGDKCRHRMKSHQEEAENFEANIDSLKKGHAKCESLLLSVRTKKENNPLRLEIRDLEKELEEIYSKFA